MSKDDVIKQLQELLKHARSRLDNIKGIVGEAALPNTETIFQNDIVALEYAINCVEKEV